MEYDYRNILKQELDRCCAVNPAYSQGAMAKRIGMTQGGLSEVLARRRGLSPERAVKIAQKLEMSPTTTQLFCESVQSQHARSPIKREIAQAKLQSLLQQGHYTELTNDLFRTIQEWHHLAIVELTKVKGFESEVSWIAKAIGISEAQAKEALQRLCRVGLLKREGGKLLATHAKLNFPAAVPSNEIRNFHHQILSKAQTALFVQPRERRHFNSVYCAINSADIPKAQKLLDQFWKKFCTTIADAKDKDRVYCLSTQFFDVKDELP